MTCVSMSATTTTSGTPSNQRITGIAASFLHVDNSGTDKQFRPIHDEDFACHLVLILQTQLANRICGRWRIKQKASVDDRGRIGNPPLHTAAPTVRQPVQSPEFSVSPHALVPGARVGHRGISARLA